MDKIYIGYMFDQIINEVNYIILQYAFVKQK